YTPGECSVSCGTQLRRSQNWRVQISSPDFLERRLPLTPLVWMSFSSFARFFCANAWTGDVQIWPPWFDRCTVAGGCFRSSQLAWPSGHQQPNYARELLLQFLLRVFGGRKQFGHTQLQLGL